MSLARDIRTLAFQTLYQFDARAGDGAAEALNDDGTPVEALIDTLDEDEWGGAGQAGEGSKTVKGAVQPGRGATQPGRGGPRERMSPADCRRALRLAARAYAGREAADAFMTEAAPAWPAHRQAAVDRAILRLAHYEMVSGYSPPKVAVNEAVELAKTFSTDKSPAFINGLLDRLLKTLVPAGASADGPPVPADETDRPAAVAELDPAVPPPGSPAGAPAA